MKMITLWLYILLGAKACRVSQDFIFPTIGESYELCGAVIVGTVENYSTPGVLNNNEIFLNDVVYYKGCGPQKVKIKGYSSGTRCGIFPPRSNRKIIVFVCRDTEDQDSWILHRYAPFAGQFSANKRHLRELEKISAVNSKCVSPIVDFDECKSRNIVNELSDYFN